MYYTSVPIADVALHLTAAQVGKLFEKHSSLTAQTCYRENDVGMKQAIA
jgi:hypothetical protein